MTRKPGWQLRLTNLITDARSKPFKYGEWDCALFVAEAVKVMTGRDINEGLGAYAGFRGGVRLMRMHGYKDHVDYMAHLFQEIDPANASQGDICVVGEDSLGIVQGRFVYTPQINGLALADRSDIVRAFHV